MLDVYVDHPNRDIINQYDEGRPFAHVDVRVVDDPASADVIFGHLDLRSGDLSLVNADLYEQYERKYVSFAACDNPKFAYETQAITVLGQPLLGPDDNRRHRVLVAPLTFGWQHRDVDDDREFIQALRKTPKTHDFVFIGNIHKIHERQFICKLDLPNFHRVVHHGKHFWFKPLNVQLAARREFLRQVAAARFAFAPRGRGTSSFRLYEALMVGTVPIITGMPDYPYTDVVDWDSFAMRAARGDNFRELLDGRDEAMRVAGMRFWDKYVQFDAGHALLVNQIERLVP